MARQLENKTTITHYPQSPFGKHAGEREIVLTYGGPDVNADEIPAMSGCTLTDPLSDDDKARLCTLGLARIDAGGRFEVNYAALRAHLQSVCGVLTDNLPGLTWPTILDILRPAETKEAGTSKVAATMSGEERAVGVLALHPDWTDKRIAEEAGVHVKTLNRYERFKKARRMLKDSGREGLPRGFKTEDGDIEAYE